MWLLAVAIAWLLVGCFGVASALRHRAYVESLPPSAGNRRIQRQRIGILIFGVVAIAIGVWRLYSYVNPRAL